MQGKDLYKLFRDMRIDYQRIVSLDYKLLQTIMVAPQGATIKLKCVHSPYISSYFKACHTEPER